MVVEIKRPVRCHTLSVLLVQKLLLVVSSVLPGFPLHIVTETKHLRTHVDVVGPLVAEGCGQRCTELLVLHIVVECVAA